MNYTDIVMVIENFKGREYNSILSEHDALGRILNKKYHTDLELAEFFSDLGKTKVGPDESGRDSWATMYETANHSYSMSFCHGREELIGFLQGNFNDMENAWSFEQGECSLKCIRFLDNHKLSVTGELLGLAEYSYRPVKHDFRQGEEFLNLNGNKYKVLQCLSSKNLLMMDLKSGQFAVGIGTGMYEKRLKSDPDGEVMTGVEWEHGIYLGNIPSQIDFNLIRQEYGEVKTHEREKDTSGEYRIEIKEALQKVVTVEADNLDEAIDKVFGMYDAGEIVLDAEDFAGKDIIPYKEHKI